MNNTKQLTCHVVPFTFMLAMLLLATACDQSSLPSASEEASNYEISALTVGQENAKVNGQVSAQLAEVRRLTAPYHDQEKAKDDGWVIPLSPCIDDPELGGMGFHYGNDEHLENGFLDPLKPEALLYEPQKNGRLRLVGVEYILPFEEPEEGGDPVVGDQPFLFGQGFDYSPHVGAWTLHVWLWRNNPSGMFAPFNPKVNCDYAQNEI